MPGKVIGTSFNYGYPGTISRGGDEITRSHAVKSNSADINFGDPVLINDDFSVSRFGATGVDATFSGVAVRRVKSASVYPNQATGKYAAYEVADVIERGPVTVRCNVGTPNATAKVYVRILDNGAVPAGVVGEFEAASDSTNSLEITNARWGTAKDANGIAELILMGRKGV